MGKRITYNFNHSKAVEAVVFIANGKPGIDIYHIAKVLFYADKMHINKYAKPILGDTYVKVDHGPLPSGTHDLITEDSWLSPEQLKLVEDSIKVEKSPYPAIVARRKPDFSYFTETDILCLEESLKKYGNKSFDELRTLTHNEKCYLETEMTQPIDYALMVDEENPIRNDIIEEMGETSAYILV